MCVSVCICTHEHEYIYIWIKCMYVFPKTTQNHVKCGYGYGYVWCLMHIICPYPLSTVHYPLHLMPYAWSIMQYFMHYAYHMHIPIRIRIWICVCVRVHTYRKKIPTICHTMPGSSCLESHPWNTWKNNGCFANVFLNFLCLNSMYIHEHFYK